MSALTDHLHALLAKLGAVSKTDVAKVETAIEAKIQPLVADAEAELRTELTTVEQQLKQQLADLEAKVQGLLDAKPATTA